MKLSAMRRRYRFVSFLRFACFLALYSLVFMALWALLAELFSLIYLQLSSLPFAYTFAAPPAAYLVFHMSRQFWRHL